MNRGGRSPLPADDSTRASPFSTAGLVALLLALIVVIWLAGRLSLLLFAAVLFAILLRTAASAVARWTRLPPGWSLAVVILLLLGTATLAGWLFAPRFAEQVREMTVAVPRAVEQLTDHLEETTWGGWILDQVSDGNPVQEDGAVVEHATSAVSGLFEIIVAAVIVIFGGVYLAAAPQSYIRGLLRLVPIARRKRAGEVLFAAGYQLRWWLLGQLLSMGVVGLTMGIGLAIIGVPLVLSLMVLTFLGALFPVVGTFAAGVVAVLVAFVSGGLTDAVLAFAVILAVQQLEGHVLHPVIMRRTIHLHPVVILFSLTAGAVLAGIAGAFLGVPFVAVAAAMVGEIRARRQLRDA